MKCLRKEGGLEMSTGTVLFSRQIGSSSEAGRLSIKFASNLTCLELSKIYPNQMLIVPTRLLNYQVRFGLDWQVR